MIRKWQIHRKLNYVWRGIGSDMLTMLTEKAFFDDLAERFPETDLDSCFFKFLVAQAPDEIEYMSYEDIKGWIINFCNEQAEND